MHSCAAKFRGKKGYKQLYPVPVKTASRDVSEEARDEADYYMKDRKCGEALIYFFRKQNFPEGFTITLYTLC